MSITSRNYGSDFTNSQEKWISSNRIGTWIWDEEKFTFIPNPTVKSADFDPIESYRIVSYTPWFLEIVDEFHHRTNQTIHQTLANWWNSSPFSSVLKKLLHNLAEIESAIAAFNSAHNFLKSRDATRNHKRIPLLESEFSVRFIEHHPEERMRQEARRNDEALPFVADVNCERTGRRGCWRRRRWRIVIFRWWFEWISEQTFVVRWFAVGCCDSDLHFLGEFLEGDHFLA